MSRKGEQPHCTKPETWGPTLNEKTRVRIEEGAEQFSEQRNFWQTRQINGNGGKDGYGFLMTMLALIIIALWIYYVP